MESKSQAIKSCNVKHVTEWLRNSEGQTRVTGGKHFIVAAVN